MFWTVLGASATGTSHLTRNVPCQDAHAHKTFGTNGEWLVIAVADGAGSASHSEIGANLVCEEFVKRVTESPTEKFSTKDGMVELFTEARQVLISKADSLNLPPRELASTALVAIVGPEEAMFGQLGDGAIVYRQDQEHRVFFWPEPLEYANVTDFLTEASFAEKLYFEKMSQPITEIAILTDGLQRLSLDYATRTPYPDFFRPLFNTLRASADQAALSEPLRLFLDSDQVNQRTDDDKTLVFAIR